MSSSESEAPATNAQQNFSSDVHHVAIKTPPFWPEKPELWFCQLEGQFHIKGITQDTTKFYYVISNLETRYASQVEEVITNPPTSCKYDTLKSELIKRLSRSQQQKLKQLLEHEEIGDRTPSQFLRHLKNLAGTTVQEEFLRTLWLNRLPATMQAILVAQSDLPLEKLAEIADKIKETHSTPFQIAAASETQSALTALTEQVRKLTLHVDELSRRPRYRPRSRSRGYYNRDRSPSETPTLSDQCWYHRNYGSNARKCKSPCTFDNGSGNATGRH